MILQPELKKRVATRHTLVERRVQTDFAAAAPRSNGQLSGGHAANFTGSLDFFKKTLEANKESCLDPGHEKFDPLAAYCSFSCDQAASARDRSIAIPHFTSGIQLYRISMNHAEYTFKSVMGIATNVMPVYSRNKIAPAQLAKTAARIDDALLFTKEGYQLYRLAVRNPDTSGIQVTLMPFVTGTVTDADGHVYKTMQYGNQAWTVENLRATKYYDGTGIPLVTDSLAWIAATTPTYCFFNYTTDTAEQRKWGALYNWYAVNTGKLAPTGWHVSTDADWDTLQNYLIAHGYNYDGTLSENKIAKSISSRTDWLASPDTGTSGNDSSQNNTSGFSGLPTGYNDYDGYTYYRNWYAFWWTTTEQDSTFVKLRSLSYAGSDLISAVFTKVYGLSVRLVRNN